MTTQPFRFLAEWEPQSAILIAWPHAQTDWAPRLGEVEEAYIQIVSAITRFNHIVIVVADDDIEAYAEARLRSNRVAMEKVRFITAPYNDTWLRDTGPITLQAADGSFRLLDFRFTGWGGKFNADDDDKLVQRLHAQGIFANAEHHVVDFALEGGAIETDGAGTLLSTFHCLHERHRNKTREEITAQLCTALHQQRVLWLENGYLEGDDTDAHIDTLARFAAPDAIIYQGCDDPSDSHYTALQAMAEELRKLRTADGASYRLFALPWAKPIIDSQSTPPRRLAASYANFLIVNDAVLMPAYNDIADASAAQVMQAAFPAHTIVQINCLPIIWQNGSLHCLTMQLPAGLLAD